jgi:hypothetical protein
MEDITLITRDGCQLSVVAPLEHHNCKYIATEYVNMNTICNPQISQHVHTYPMVISFCPSTFSKAAIR